MNSALLGAGLAAIGVIGGGIGIGLVGKGLLDALARNPQVSGKAMVYAILGMALAEATSIYALVIAFMLMGKSS
jgi:F-type H+-transporting ATPase subunit c